MKPLCGDGALLRSPIDSYLEIHKVGGGRLAAADDSGGPDAVQAFKIPADGEYMVAIRDHLNQGSPIHAYRIEITAPTPALSLEIAELQRYESQTIEVPARWPDGGHADSPAQEL